VTHPMNLVSLAAMAKGCHRPDSSTMGSARCLALWATIDAMAPLPTRLRCVRGEENSETDEPCRHLHGPLCGEARGWGECSGG
jgi:hypothetical protein